MPDAPPPRYDSRHKEAGRWLVTVEYDPVPDEVRVTRWEAETMHRSERRWTNVYPVAEHRAICDAVLIALDVVNTRRLF